MRIRLLSPLAGVLAAAAVLAAGLAGQPAEAASVKPKPKASTAAEPPSKPGAGIETQAKHALVLEVETGTVLLDKGADERIPPASMSKVMTAYMVFDYLKQGRAKLDDELPVSETAWRTGGSKMFVPIGSRIKIDDLLRGMIIQSGNDACVVLAEGLAGSLAAFLDQMNEKAKQIGLKDSHFANVDGLPDRIGIAQGKIGTGPGAAIAVLCRWDGCGVCQGERGGCGSCRLQTGQDNIIVIADTGR